MVQAIAQFARNLTAKICLILAVQKLSDLVVQRQSFCFH